MASETPKIHDLRFFLTTQEHTIQLCVQILQILFESELSWFWIAGNGHFCDFCTCYVPLCSKKLSVQCQCDGNFWSSTNHKIEEQLRIQSCLGFFPNSYRWPQIFYHTTIVWPHTLCCISLGRCCLGLETRVIIKISKNPCYPINMD